MGNADISADGMQLVGCPSCNQNTLKMENGCHTCLNGECGFSKCDV